MAPSEADQEFLDAMPPGTVRMSVADATDLGKRALARIGFSNEDADIILGQELAYLGRQFGQANHGAAGIISLVFWLIGQHDAGKNLGHVLHMNDAAHRIGVGESDGLAARRLAHTVYVIDGAKFFIWAGYIGRAYASNRHAIGAAVIVGLPFIDDFIDCILGLASPFVGFVDQALAEFGLLAGNCDRAGKDRVLDAAAPGRFKAIIHALNVELERDVGRQIANKI